MSLKSVKAKHLEYDHNSFEKEKFKYGTAFSLPISEKSLHFEQNNFLLQWNASSVVKRKHLCGN